MIPFIIAWLSDSGAYFAGRTFGQRKLAPVISPKKTVEGMVGGILCAMVGMVLYMVILNLVFGFEVNYLYALVYGLGGSLCGVFGDLCFSVIKRQTGIKDYSKLIPGHGGMLDRFDSMSFAAPTMWVLVSLLPAI
jgi:phosphatidate cytidylyltransferase